MDARAGRQPHQQPPVLERVGQVLRGEDRGPAVLGLGDAGRGDGRQPGALEVEQDLVLAPAGLERQLLERVQRPVGGQEADEVPRRPDRQLPEGERRGRPVGERRLPRQVDEGDRRVAEVEARKRRHRRAGESIAAVRGGASIPSAAASARRQSRFLR